MFIFGFFKKIGKNQKSVVFGYENKNTSTKTK